MVKKINLGECETNKKGEFKSVLTGKLNETLNLLFESKNTCKPMYKGCKETEYNYCIQPKDVKKFGETTVYMYPNITIDTNKINTYKIDSL
uniref:Phlebovirus glycoprotein G2 fusion domain-containing protein n=1 Tax=Parastrongyloides trichosuri TaxID=131310 RepID=A0A0N5A2R9_PARTI